MQGGLSSLFFIAFLIAIFYFMLIRPQKKRVQAHQELIASVTEGDDVVTIGGIFGVVRLISEDNIELEISPGTTIRIIKSAIARKLVDDAEGWEGSGETEDEDA